jgi:hypothetical protein
MQIPKLDRTPSNHRAAGGGVCRCIERKFDGQENKPPVKLVVFDCDETLTLSTFMPKDKGFGTSIGWNQWGDYIAGVNFESPFVDGSRLEKLRNLMKDLIKAEDGSRRTLAVLTRNERGPIACLNLLSMAKISPLLSVIWALPFKPGNPAGVYREGDKWFAFNPPIAEVNDHKADVLVQVALKPAAFLPQLTACKGEDQLLQHMLDAKLENIVLVDDVRTNFQSPFTKGAKMFRYCKVARYDGNHPQMGFVTDMGGLGAQSTNDYAVLKKFVEKPWDFAVTDQIECLESECNETDDRPETVLTVFEFDETISICTFVIEEDGFNTEIGYAGYTSEMKAQCLLYNFGTPYIKEGDRVAKLDKMFANLAEERTLSILTENTAGAVAVLNLLLIAGLAKHFHAIWAPNADSGLPTGAYQQGGTWKIFDCPHDKLDNKTHRAEAINVIVKEPTKWFPQLTEAAKGTVFGKLLDDDVTCASVVCVDDERTNFHASADSIPQSVLRYCRVARYDDEYRDMGFLIHMGGLGAKTDKDYLDLEAFVSQPWRFRVVDAPSMEAFPSIPMTWNKTEKDETIKHEDVGLVRRETEDHIEKTPARRRTITKPPV